MSTILLISTPQAMEAHEGIPTSKDISAERTIVANAVAVKDNPAFNQRYQISNYQIITPVINLITKMKNDLDYMPSQDERKRLYTCALVMQNAETYPNNLVTFENYPGIKFLRENSFISYNDGLLKLKHAGQWIELSRADVDWAMEHINNLIVDAQANVSQAEASMEQESSSSLASEQEGPSPLPSLPKETSSEMVLFDESKGNSTLATTQDPNTEDMPTPEEIIIERYNAEKKHVGNDHKYLWTRDPITNYHFITPLRNLIKKMEDYPNYMPTSQERWKLYICYSVMRDAQINPNEKLITKPAYPDLIFLKENPNISYDKEKNSLKLRHEGQTIELSMDDVNWAIHHIDDLIDLETNKPGETNYEGVLLDAAQGSGGDFYLVKVTRVGGDAPISKGDLLYLHSDQYAAYKNAKPGQIVYFDNVSPKPIKTVDIKTNHTKQNKSINVHVIAGVRDIRAKGTPGKQLAKKSEQKVKPTLDNAKDLDDYIRGNRLMKNIDKESSNWIVFNGLPALKIIRDLIDYSKGNWRVTLLQGFKLHVSATPESALRVLAAVKSVLEDPNIPITERVMYKMAKSMDFLRELNNGRQRGKFITIYPLDIKNPESTDKNYAKAVELAKKLDIALQKLSPNDFINIAFEKPLGASGGLFTRYGILFGNGKELYVIDENHLPVSEWYAKDEEDSGQSIYKTQPDERYGPWKPDWVPDIFEGM